MAPTSGPNKRAGAADCGLHHELARGVEGESVRRHEALQHAEQAAGKARISRSDNKGGKLVAVNIVAHGGCAQRIIADSAQDGADRRAHDAQRDRNADEIPERQERVERPVSVEVDGGKAEMKGSELGRPASHSRRRCRRESGLNSTK